MPRWNLMAKRLPLIKLCRLTSWRGTRSWVKIDHRGVFYTFPLEKNSYYKKSFWTKISTAFPLKYIVGPIKKLVNKNRYTPEFTHSTPYEKKFRGFMVFSKPKYKPR